LENGAGRGHDSENGATRVVERLTQEGRTDCTGSQLAWNDLLRPAVGLTSRRFTVDPDAQAICSLLVDRPCV
jgi:hypothetical protein